MIKYMEMNSTTSEKKHAEMLESLKGKLSEMEKEVMKAMSEVAVMEEGLVKESGKLVG